MSTCLSLLKLGVALAYATGVMMYVKKHERKDDDKSRTIKWLLIMRQREDRMVEDLTEEEYKDYEKHPENWEEVTNNAIDYYRETMGIDDDE